MSRFQNRYGIGFRTPEHLVFFGGKNFDESTLRSEFTENSYLRIKQTHSSIVVEASESLREADAHFTGKKSAALIVATADCIPLMIYCRQTRQVAAVHAGWKGIENQIAINTLNSLKAAGSSQSDFVFYVGPHILQSSFETDRDVYDALTAAHPGLDPVSFSVLKDGKYYLSLANLMRYQIEKTIQKPADIISLEIDTKTSANFHSYRRGKHSSERNLSFIAQF